MKYILALGMFLMLAPAATAADPTETIIVPITMKTQCRNETAEQLRARGWSPVFQATTIDGSGINMIWLLPNESYVLMYRIANFPQTCIVQLKNVIFYPPPEDRHASFTQ